jgi:predicted ester cyclase
MAEQNRSTVLRFFQEVVGDGRLEVLDEIAVDDYEDYVALPGQGPGRSGLKERVARIRAAFQPRQTLHQVVVDSDRVAVHWTLFGVHAAEFAGIEPSGRAVQFDGVDLYRMRDGRIAAHWNVVDLWSLYRQSTGAGGSKVRR